MKAEEAQKVVAKSSTTSYERKKKEAIQIELQLLTCDRMAMGLASLRNCI
jgi:hypothetical protein